MGIISRLGRKPARDGALELHLEYENGKEKRNQKSEKEVYDIQHPNAKLRGTLTDASKSRNSCRGA